MRIVLIIFIFAFCNQLMAQDHIKDKYISAELVWVESAGDDYNLMFSRLTEEKWSEPITVYNSESSISSPLISTDHEQNKLLVWSEQYRNSRILMSARRTASESSWQRAEKINHFKGENLGSSMVVDKTNQSWLFWSSNYEDLDDIYYSRHDEAKWSGPRRVHVKNDVPDIQPIASLNKDLDVAVSWKTYDRLSGQYTTVQQIFTIDKSSENRYKSRPRNNKENSVSDITLPDFLPQSSTIGLHFPNNQIEQSIRLYLNR